MMKARQPETIEAAIEAICGVLGGSDAAGAVVGKSGALVRKWSDPDCDGHRIPLEAAMALDAACKAAGGGTPIADMMSRRLDQVDAPAPRPVDPSTAMLGVTAAVGTLAAAVQAAVHPSSPGGARLTLTERHGIAEQLRPVEQQLDMIRHVIRPNAAEIVTMPERGEGAA